MVFTAQPTLAAAQAFYSDLKNRAAKFGRGPDEIKIMPGVFAVVGRTRSRSSGEAYDRLQSLVDPVAGLALLSRMIRKL